MACPDPGPIRTSAATPTLTPDRGGFSLGLSHCRSPSIQPGDGGWGYIVQIQTFATAFHNAVAYLSGSYLINPRKLSDVPMAPGSNVFWSVPDVYTSRAGLAFGAPLTLGEETE